MKKYIDGGFWGEDYTVEETWGSNDKVVKDKYGNEIGFIREGLFGDVEFTATDGYSETVRADWLDKRTNKEYAYSSDYLTSAKNDLQRRQKNDLQRRQNADKAINNSKYVGKDSFESLYGDFDYISTPYKTGKQIAQETYQDIIKPHLYKIEEINKSSYRQAKEEFNKEKQVIYDDILQNNPKLNETEVRMALYCLFTLLYQDNSPLGNRPDFTIRPTPEYKQIQQRLKVLYQRVDDKRTGKAKEQAILYMVIGLLCTLFPPIATTLFILAIAKAVEPLNVDEIKRLQNKQYNLLKTWAEDKKNEQKEWYRKTIAYRNTKEVARKWLTDKRIRTQYLPS